MFEEEFEVNVVHAWGMTETSPLGVTGRLRLAQEPLQGPERLAQRAKQGYPVPLIEFRIVDDQGKVCAWDGKSIGEIQGTPIADLSRRDLRSRPP